MTLSGAGTVLGDVCAILFIVCLITSGATWIMGSDRALAVSCYDGAGPRFLGVISAKFGTPVRVNIFSGIVASVVVVLADRAHQRQRGEVLRRGARRDDLHHADQLPAHLPGAVEAAPQPTRTSPGRSGCRSTGPLTVLLMVLVAIASVQLIAPGLGDHWFGSDFRPDGWTYGERWVYLWTELIPVLVFIAVGVLFWWLGRKTRAEVVTSCPRRGLRARRASNVGCN